MTSERLHPGQGKCPVVHFDHRDLAQTTSTANEFYRGFLQEPTPIWSDTNGGFWILSHYDHVRAAAADWERYSSAKGVFIPPFTIAETAAPPIEMDPPQSRPYRRLFNDWLSPRRLPGYREMIHELTDRHVSAFVSQGGGDFVSQVAVKLPIQVIARALGLKPELSEQLWVLSDRVSRGDSDAIPVMMGIFFEQITMRRNSPQDDFLTILVESEVDGAPIPDETLMSWVFAAIFAGHDTTLLSGVALMKDLAIDEDLQDRLRANPAIIPAAVEESLRFNSPVQRFFRTLTEDVEVEGVTMRAGDKVMLAYAAGNLDEKQFSSPEVLDVDRLENRHMAFGHGVHRCAGAPLALIELADLAETMLDKGKFTLAAPPRLSPPTVNGNFLGIDRLELAVTAYARP